MHCWECLLECRLCPQLIEIRALEEQPERRPAMLTDKVYSLLDLQFWHQRNVANMQARVDRIKGVLAAWEKPSDTLGDVLEKNGKLIEDMPKIIATDPAKAVYDTLHDADAAALGHSAARAAELTPIDEVDKFIKICECRRGQTPDDVLRAGCRRLEPAQRLVRTAAVPSWIRRSFSGIICCLTRPSA